MIRRGDGDQRDRRKLVHRQALQCAADGGEDSEARRAVPQALLRAAERFGEQRHRQAREQARERFQALAHKAAGKHRVDRDGEFGLDVRGDLLGARPQGLGAVHQAPRVAEDHFARVRQHRRFAVACEQRDAEGAFEGLDGLADTRLHAGQPPPGGGKAAGFGHGDEGTELVEGQAVEHLSIINYDEYDHKLADFNDK
jgi:hypothetical protein